MAKAATVVSNPGTVLSRIARTVAPRSSVARPATHVSRSCHTSVSSDTSRTMIRASANGAMTLSASPPEIIPTLIVVAPSSASWGSCSHGSSASNVTSFAIADSPSSG